MLSDILILGLKIRKVMTRAFEQPPNYYIVTPVVQECGI